MSGATYAAHRAAMARGESLLPQFTAWARGLMMEGHVVQYRCSDAPKLLLARQCAGVWFPADLSAPHRENLAQVLASLDAVPDSEKRGFLWLLPEALISFVATRVPCPAAEVTPRAVELLCALARAGRVMSPIRPQVGGYMSGEPEPAAWHWPYWMRTFDLPDLTAAQFIDFPARALAPWPDSTIRRV